MSSSAMCIRIISAPPGEAPEHVRAAWIGLVLPLAVAQPRTARTVGALSVPKTKLGLYLWRVFGRVRHSTGYVVIASRAVDLLASHAPDAAAWWRQHSPKSLQPGYQFIFATEVCEEISPDT